MTPWQPSRSARKAVEADTECDVVVVGAGFGGLYALHKLRESGFSVRGLEAAPDVGGTWYWNRYPGARCDVPSLFYSYSWSPELRREWRWTNRYAGQEEILSYARFAADRLDLRKLIQFDTRVAGATFDEKSERWIVETDRGTRLSARFVIMATGGLSIPNTPDIPGVADFKGAIYHTARWPQEPVELRGQAHRHHRHGLLRRPGDPDDRRRRPSSSSCSSARPTSRCRRAIAR